MRLAPGKGLNVLCETKDTGFFTGLPPIIWVLLAVMTLDYITGLLCGLAGKSPKTETGGLSSKTAFEGLLKKVLILIVV